MPNLPKDFVANALSQMERHARWSRLAIVVPVFRGERTLELLLSAIEPLTKPGETARGRHFQVAEVVLVHDGAIDDSQAVMQALAARFPFVTLVWLSRNFGQHPATLGRTRHLCATWETATGSAYGRSWTRPHGSPAAMSRTRSVRGGRATRPCW